MKRGALLLTLGVVVAAAAGAQTAPTNVQPPPQPPPAPVAGSVELDHVVAIVGSNVLLESDVVQEMHLSALEPLQVLPGQNTPAVALRRLIDRTLIMEQMKEQEQPLTVPASELQNSLTDLRKTIPACHTKYPCATEPGWEDFLRANGLTRDMVEQRWNQRMAILRFVDLRFRSGIRISQDQISAYYQKTLVPALEKSHETAPPLADVSSRIREILLEQQVSGLFQDWLSSLRDQGNIRIVDQAYSADLDTSQNATAGEQSQ
ncbi:MAG: peptidylprolyl isomerase [Acidobacteriaceae bacterium]